MKPETQNYYEQAVRRAAEQVVEALDSALDLQVIARAAAMSAFHFHRVFRGAFGETPLELHRRLRLERAAWSLFHSDVPITSIAFGAGYETHESFTRAFRAHYACSPSEFRQSRDDVRASCERPRPIEIPARSGVHYRPERIQIPSVNFLGTIIMDVQIKEMPELRVAALAHIGPYNQIGKTFGKLGQVVKDSGLLAHASDMVGIFYDDPETTPASELRSDAGLVVSADAVLPPELTERRITAGRYAVTVHHGSYAGLPDSWARFYGEWLPRSGYVAKDGLSYERYRNTPEQHANPDELRTEIYIPLA